MPHESPLQSVHLLRRDEGSLTLNELTVLYTTLSKQVEHLQIDLQQTKKVYSSALTKLILRVKKLENTVGAEHSTVIPEVSIAAENLVYIRKSDKKKKDKGKGIMTEPEPEKKTKKARQEQEVVAKDDQAHVIDWRNPADKNQSFVPMDSEKEKGSEKKGSRKKALARKRVTKKKSEESTKMQKIEDDIEKEELKAYLDLNSYLVDGQWNFHSHDDREEVSAYSTKMLSKMLSRKLEVDHENEMAFELL
ncbi:hypothetical protein Tco_1379417, partial [Tanacetum coccineum]